MIISIILAPLFPVPVEANTKIKLALVRVTDRENKSNLFNAQNLIQEFLLKTNRFNLISSERITNFYQKKMFEKRDPYFLTGGDYLYLEAHDLFLSFKHNQSLEVVKSAITQLKKNPGKYGNLFKAYLLKTQLLWELDRYSQANIALKNAVIVGGKEQKLSQLEYSPKIQKSYRRAYKSYARLIGFETIEINLKGKRKSPIFSDGLFKGVASELYIIKAKKHKAQVSAGTSLKSEIKLIESGSMLLAAKNSRRIKKGIYSRNVEAGNSHQLISQLEELGLYVDSDLVVLLDMQEFNHMKRLFVRIYNVRNKKITREKYFDLVDGLDISILARECSDYIKGLKPTSFIALKREDFQYNDNNLQPSKLNKTIVYGAIGAVIVGAGIGLALALGGSSESGDSSGLTEVSISGPLPNEI